jgi:hypothetical protein
MELIQFSEDFNEEEKKLLIDFKVNGLPGVGKIEEEEVVKWFQLYMSGKTYSEIAQFTRNKKELVLYVSEKCKWFDKKMNYYSDLSLNISNKLMQVKVDSANNLTSIISALGKYYGNRFTEYLSTGNDTIIKNIDTELLAKYYKSMEILDKIVNDRVKEPKKPSSAPSNSPQVTVNVSGDAVIKQQDDKNVEIETKNDVEDIFKILSKYKKQHENSNKED